MIGTLLSRLKGRTEPEEDEWANDTQVDPPTFLRDGEWQRGALPVRLAPLVWSMTPPRKPGWYWCRFPGSADHEVIRIEAGFEYGAGLEWSSSALPEPPP